MAVSAWMLWYGLSMFQVAPVYLINRPDITGNLLWTIGLYKPLLHSEVFRLCLDVTFFLLPFFVVLSVRRRWRIRAVLALFTSLFAMAYAYMLSATTFLSIEVFTAQIFFPLVFTALSIRGIYYRLHMVRIVFILLFFTTALWKIRAGGVFNMEQMSGILLRQHTSILLEPQQSWFTTMLTHLIDQKGVSYSLYFFTVILEFIFAVGFFTTRFDRILIALFCLFIGFDYVLMEINYFSWLPFMGCLYYSQLPEPQ